MRISTSQIFNSGLESIQKQQAELNRVQMQLASGKRVLSPSDDPAAAVQSMQFRESIARLDQFARNGGLAESRLHHEESVLDQVMDSLQRVRELAIQGNNATQSNETRQAIALEIRQHLDHVYELANARDANGEYLFAGFASLDRPFTATPAGAVYNGGSQAREIAIGDLRRIPLGDTGDAVFMGITEGNGRFVVTESAGNSGTGSVQDLAVTAAGTWNGGPRTLVFTAPDAWEARDPGGNVVGSGSYTAGGTLNFEGLAVRLGGAPAAGDSFELNPAGTRDLFGIYADLAVALETPSNGPGDTARLNGAIGRVLADLDQAVGQISSVRSGIGARLNTIESQANQREVEILEMNRTLSEIEDLDYAEAISRFNLRMVGLQAAQQSYTMFSRLSLFDYIR